MNNRSHFSKQRGRGGRGGRGSRTAHPNANRGGASIRGRGRGRGRSGTRARGRGRGGLNCACYNCGQQGHFSRECPNNRNDNQSYARSNRSQRYPPTSSTNSDPSQRFHDESSQSLIAQVQQMNSIDVVGPQHVEVVQYSSGWQKVESLSSGGCYYFRPKTSHSPKQTCKRKPNDLDDTKIECVTVQDQGSSFTTRPHPAIYSNVPYITNVSTNAYQLNGSFLQNTVHTYDVVFDPPLSTQDVLERKNAVLGITSKEKRRNHDLLNAKFGFWEWNNNHLLSINNSKESSNIELELSDKYRVIFMWKDSAAIAGSELELTEEEQILNTFKHRSMKDAGFRRVRDYWFYRNVNNPPPMLKFIAPQKISPQLTLLPGFGVSMRLHETDNNGKIGILKCNLQYKQISSKSIHEMISDIAMNKGMDFGSLEFENKVTEQLKGRYFVMSYSAISYKICEVNFKKNEQWQFELNTGAKTSVTQYLKKRYGIRKVRHEICVLEDQKGSVFLPQFAYLTLRSNDITNENIKRLILERTNPGVAEELQRVNALVKHMNKTGFQSEAEEDDEKKEKKPSLRYQLKVNEGCIRTKAVKLPYPDICFKALNGIKRVPLTKEFKWKETKGFLRDLKPIRHWIIVSSNKNAINTVTNMYHNYLRMRGFDRNSLPLHEPKTMMMNMKDPMKAQHEILKVFKSFKERLELVFLILPPSTPTSPKLSSEIKTRFTKALQSYKTVKNGGCLIQAMMESTVLSDNRNKQRDAILGAIEQSLCKFGNILYQIIPKLPSNSPYNLDRIWTVGLASSHGGNVKGIKGGGTHNPTVVTLCLQTLPFYGTQRHLRNVIYLNSARKMVLPFLATVTMMMNALRGAIQQLKNDKTRPQTIIVFRDGIGDNGLKEVYSKEVTGIKRAIIEMKHELKIKYKIDWKIRLQFIVVSDPIDKFGVSGAKHGHIEAIKAPVVVIDNVVSKRLFDILLWPFHPNNGKEIQKLKCKRYCVIKDELRLGELQKKAGKIVNHKSNAPVHLFSIIYSLSFAYHPALPFIQGGTSVPSAVIFSKHFCEKFAQMILASDKCVNDLRMSNKTNLFIVTRLMDLSKNVKTVKALKGNNDAQNEKDQSKASASKPKTSKRKK